MRTKQHPHVEAARMAADDMNDLMGFIKDSEYGSYPKAKDPRTISRKERIASLPDDIRNGGYSTAFLDRLARLAEDE